MNLLHHHQITQKQPKPINANYLIYCFILLCSLSLGSPTTSFAAKAIPPATHTGRSTATGSASTVSFYPSDQQLYDQYPWAALYFYGITGSDALGTMFQGTFHRWPEHIQSLELTHTLGQDNFLRRLVSPLVGVVQASANISMRNDSQKQVIYEFNPYVEGRWANLPWNKVIATSFAIGEGVSYATSIPSLEGKSSGHTKRLLNYLLLEATLALPTHPCLQLVVRIHHRSGAYGLYHAGNTGSNVIGLGIRYLFD